MTKSKTSLFSFAAHGSIADSLTYQQHHAQTMVRKKPTPLDRQSLPQIYQRWLYQDYAALWHILSAAEKHVWETNARPYHMSGFAYWMRDRLTDLPDIAGMWHLDHIINGSVADFSRNGNTGTVYGPIITDGRIDHALSFDGVDDYVLVPYHASLEITDTLSICAWVRIPEVPTSGESWLIARPYNYLFNVETNTTRLRVYLVCTGGGLLIWADTNISLNRWHHVAFTYDKDESLRIYIDGQLDASPVANKGAITPYTGMDLIFGRKWDGSNPFKGAPDHVFIYNRVLDAIEIQRRAERSYPL